MTNLTVNAPDLGRSAGDVISGAQRSLNLVKSVECNPISGMAKEGSKLVVTNP